METKEQILKRLKQKRQGPLSGYIWTTTILKSMDVYAEEVSVKFAEWIVDKAVHRYDRKHLIESTANMIEWETNDWLILWSVNKKQFFKTTKELYQLFKNRK